MHPKVERALAEIDAAIFSGDTFEDRESRATLLEYLERWARELELLTENPLPLDPNFDPRSY